MTTERRRSSGQLPIARMDEYFVFLWKKEIYFTSDAYSGYWRIELHEQDEDKTSPVTDNELYR